MTNIYLKVPLWGKVQNDKFNPSTPPQLIRNPHLAFQPFTTGEELTQLLIFLTNILGIQLWMLHASFHEKYFRISIGSMFPYFFLNSHLQKKLKFSQQEHTAFSCFSFQYVLNVLSSWSLVKPDIRQDFFEGSEKGHYPLEFQLSFH